MTDSVLALFVSRLQDVGVHVHRATDEADAAQVVAEVVKALGASDVACSDSPLVRGVTSGLPTFDGWRDRDRLATAELGVTGVQAAIAETGTLMLASPGERSRLTSLVPPVHLALVRQDQVVRDLDEAFASIGPDPPGAVTFITGPSRTADIELTLVVGVHGPREVHVVVIE